MFTVTIQGNSIEELYANMQTLLNQQPSAQMQAPTPHQAPPSLAQPTQQFHDQQSQAKAMLDASAQATPQAPQQPMAQPPAMPQQPPAQVAPAPQPPMSQQPSAMTVPPTQPAPSPFNAMPPAASAPTYTLDQLAKAGAALAQSGKMEDALALLARYGVQTVNQLPPEQYGNFATELRALGAQV